AATAPNPDAPPGEMGFAFDRAGARVPTLAISAWSEGGTIVNAPFEHAAVIKTLSRQWELGNLTERDKAAPDLGVIFNRETPRPLDATAVNNLGVRMNGLQWGITGLTAAIFDDAVTLERDRATVAEWLGYMRRQARRLGL